MLRTQSAEVPDKDARVRVISCAGAPQHVGKLGTVARFHVGFRYSISVALDDETGLFAFAPHELEEQT